MTKELFTPTVRHTSIFNSMSDKEKNAAATCVQYLGYYGCIQFLMSITGGNKTEKMAKYIADIGLYMV